MIAQHYIDGRLVSPAIEQQAEPEVEAVFTDGNVQGNVTSDGFTFILEAFEILNQKIEDGRILEPVSYRIDASDETSINVFDGVIDMSESNLITPFGTGNENSPNIQTSIRENEDLNNFYQNLEALNWNFLESEGALSPARDVDYTVEDYYSGIKLVIISAQIFSFSQALIENAYKIQAATATFLGILSGSITGGVGAAIYAGVNLAALIAYQIAIGALLYSLVVDIARTYAIPKRKAKCQTVGSLLRDALAYLGYTLRTDIADLDRLAIMDSNPNLDGLFEGFIRTPQGPVKGYPDIVANNCLDFLNLIKAVFNAQTQIKDGEMWFYRTLSPVWRKNSTYRMPDMEEKQFNYNTQELIGLHSIKFAFDSSDVFTLQESARRAFIVKYTNESENTIKGREGVEIPFALAARKTSLNALEQLLNGFFKIANTTLGIFGFKYKNNFTNKIGSIKIETNNWATPKMFFIEGTKVASQDVSAEYLWDNYHFDKSPLTEGRQTKQYSVDDVPFGLSDLNKTLENSYITTIGGEFAKVNKLNWLLNQDVASMEYEIDFQYTDRITETKINVE